MGIKNRLRPLRQRMNKLLRPLRQRVNYLKFKLTNRNTVSFACPICLYEGPFEDVNDPTGLRKHAKCPKCSALERHRIQFLVMQKVLELRQPEQLSLLHFAPEQCLVDLFRSKFGHYETANLAQDRVNHNVDIQYLPFEDGSYDFVLRLPCAGTYS